MRVRHGRRRAEAAASFAGARHLQKGLGDVFALIVPEGIVTVSRRTPPYLRAVEGHE